MEPQICIFNIQKFSIHDGPGIRTVVFFKGCPLRCYWCANPESQHVAPEKMWDEQQKKITTVGEYRTVSEIMEEVLQDEPFYEESGGGVTLSGGEILQQPAGALALLRALKARGIHTACETTGAADEKVFAEFLDQVDLIFFDVKHYDALRHQKGTGQTNTRILNNLRQALASSAEVIVRIPVIPGFNDALSDAHHFIELFHELQVKKLELLPFHQFGEKKYAALQRHYRLEGIPQIHSEDLTDYEKIFTDHHLECFIR